MKCLTLIALLLVISVAAYGSAFTSGNLVVVEAGTNGNTVTLNGNTTAASLLEYTTAGSFIQQINIPTVASGANNAFTISGSATTEGFIARSTDGQYLALGGYNLGVTAGTGNGSAANVVNRVIARVDASGNIDTSTSITNAASTGNIRSVVTDNGSRFWVTTSSSGMNYVPTFGSQNITTNMYSGGSGPSNVRVTRIFNGQLYNDTSSGAFQSIMTNGVGLPTSTTGGVLGGILPGLPTASGPSPYGFFMADMNNDTVLDTAWIADDRAAASGGGIQKWTFNGSLWSLAYVLGTNGTTLGVRGLTVDLSGADPVLYATTTEANANRLISVVDTGAASALTTLATAGVNQAFRGVDFAPSSIPEPSTILGVGLVLMLAGRRIFRRS